MKYINVNTPLNKYKIVFEKDFHNILGQIKQLGINYSNIGIISDDNVAPLYSSELVTSIKELNVSTHTFIFPHGESNKNYTTINSIYDFMINNNFDRKSLLIALGGGVVGDMTGFVAATYMRGIDFIQIPTSLLAQVDSSIGGKTGIDFNGYKNIIGAFYQPKLVYVNTATLGTLEKREFASGMAEIIKHALIMDSDYLNSLEKEYADIIELDHNALQNLIANSCEIKSKVVSEDEKEQGLRAILNFGHTIGHAIERLKNFTLTHGECVALGMIASSNISMLLGDLSLEDVKYIEHIIKLYNLPVKVTGLELDTVYQELFHDKKTLHNQINIILLDTLGSCYQNKNLTKKEIQKGLKAILK